MAPTESVLWRMKVSEKIGERSWAWDQVKTESLEDRLLKEVMKRHKLEQALESIAQHSPSEADRLIALRALGRKE